MRPIKKHWPEEISTNEMKSCDTTEYMVLSSKSPKDYKANHVNVNRISNWTI